MKFLLFLILFFGVKCFSQTRPTYSNVDYVGDGDSRHLMDIYIPSDIVNPTKTVVYIHGGGWRNGSKASTMPFCQELYDAGYVVVGINYRLSQDSIFPAQIFDCKASIRFLKTNAQTYKIDTCNIGVTGRSAGGHLAALMGTSNGEPSLEGLHLGNSGVSSNVHSVVDFFGPTDFLQMDSFASPLCNNPLIHNTLASPESKLLGCLISSCPERVAKANPLSYINGNEPPFMIHHGDADCLVPLHQSEILHDRLIAEGQSSQLTVYAIDANRGHGNFINASVLDSMVLFFNNTLVNNCNTSNVGDQNSEIQQIKIYPNPAKDILNIESTINIDSVKIFNTSGFKVLETFKDQSNSY